MRGETWRRLRLGVDRKRSEYTMKVTQVCVWEVVLREGSKATSAGLTGESRSARKRDWNEVDIVKWSGQWGCHVRRVWPRKRSWKKSPGVCLWEEKRFGNFMFPGQKVGASGGIKGWMFTEICVRKEHLRGFIRFLSSCAAWRPELRLFKAPVSLKATSLVYPDPPAGAGNQLLLSQLVLTVEVWRAKTPRSRLQLWVGHLPSFGLDSQCSIKPSRVAHTFHSGTEEGEAGKSEVQS